MAKVAVIGGTGLTSLEGMTIREQKMVDTPYGSPSAPLIIGAFGEHEIIFLPRHGSGHTLAPHKVNYRANIHVLKEHGVEYVIAANAVGAIHKDFIPGYLCIPDQIIDYTGSRAHTFYEEGDIFHVDFTHPYCEDLRQVLISAAETSDGDFKLIPRGVYGVTQGPRLETAAEIKRMERDGCDLVGMTAMPEAALAREVGLCYASIAISVNWAAGLSDDIITMEDIQACLSDAIGDVKRLLANTLKKLN